ncbi:hypothetical protein [Nocardioides terrisoli]|uniref:hypothetical protein n=1 Tax=Nocardioides terrisoli TaxID=3388267 RepID=UPI00287B8FA5|nr:hypothetical protein [Nocardioides marmorisolisilvae]
MTAALAFILAGLLGALCIGLALFDAWTEHQWAKRGDMRGADFLARWDAALSDTPIHDALAAETFRDQLDEGRQG